VAVETGGGLIAARERALGCASVLRGRSLQGRSMQDVLIIVPREKGDIKIKTLETPAGFESTAVWLDDLPLRDARGGA
jgi:hypothetical protein